MQALVLIAHGSRRQASNQEVKDLAARLRHASSDRYPLIKAGFLELVLTGADQFPRLSSKSS